jgi:hypothetical protein
MSQRTSRFIISEFRIAKPTIPTDVTVDLVVAVEVLTTVVIDVSEQNRFLFKSFL